MVIIPPKPFFLTLKIARVDFREQKLRFENVLFRRKIKYKRYCTGVFFNVSEITKYVLHS
jgi:hypothetical protein